MFIQELSRSIQNAIHKLGFKDQQVEISLVDNPRFGDYASNIALQLSKHRGNTRYHSPSEIADKISEILVLPAFVERVEVAGPGFLNFYVKSDAFAKELLQIDKKDLQSTIGAAKKVLLEHTGVNPNKAMHVGHLRNALIGDCLANVLRRAGFRVETQNYIDDTGVQVVDTYVGVKFKKELGFRDQKPNEPEDDYYWEVYAAVNKKYEEDPEFMNHRQQVSKEVEDQQSATAKEVKEIATKIVSATEQTLLNRFGIVHNLYVWESDILASGFWDQAFEILKKTPGFENPQSGKNKGTWLVRIDRSTPRHSELDSESTKITEIPKQVRDDENFFDNDKIFVKSDGTTTYVAKDFAYNLWKFGLLGKDFKYRVWDRVSLGRPVAKSQEQLQNDLATKLQSEHTIYTSDQEKGKESEGFGKGDYVYTVIDERQSYLQQVIMEVFDRLGFKEQAAQFKHVSYGFVSLSANTAKALGMGSNSGKRSYAMSGRRGIGVEVKKLHDLVTDKVVEEKKSRKVGKEDGVDSAKIATAAIKYFMLKFNSATEIIFDFDQALSLYGATGPYLQYTYARVCGILEKGKHITWKVGSYEPNEVEVAVIKQLLQWRSVLEETAQTLEPSTIAQYAFTLAQLFNSFYEKNQVLGASTNDEVTFRLQLVAKFQLVFKDVLNTLGIYAPERM
jgi:arginyl-tRNA synthetase